tara:strand:- start:54212 stop:55672 length:1461 start_codon:yes stop_codon:yes gene_type:complete
LVQVDTTDTIFIKLLIERLSWPVKLARWRAARGVRELLHSDRWHDETTALLLEWIETRQFESEVETALSVLLVTDASKRPSFDEVVERIQLSSFLSDLLLERMYGPGFIHAGWKWDAADPPTEFVPDRYFVSHKTQDVPRILSMHFERLEEKHGAPFMRQWAFEWKRVQERSSAPYSDYPYYFGDASLARVGLHPQCMTQQSEVLRSAYQRTLGHAVVFWGMPLRDATFYVTHTLLVLPGLFEVDPTGAPAWLGTFATDCCNEQADLECLAKAAIAASNGAGEGSLLSVTVPTPREIAEFGEVSLRSFFVSDDFQHRAGVVLPEVKEFVIPDAFGLIGDIRPLDTADWKSAAQAGSVIPATFKALPALLGTWHDEYFSSGLRVPCSYCFNGPTKLDADRGGLKVLRAGSVVARTTFWQDAWTPINLPIGGTRVGVATYISPEELTAALAKMELKLAWEVRITIYDPETNWDKLGKKERSAFFLQSE